MKRGITLGVAFLVMAWSLGCGRTGSKDTKTGGNGSSGANLAGLKGSIKCDGSSTVFPVTSAMAEKFQEDTKGGVRVSVGQSGTGGGFKKFTRGDTDVSNASRPILKKEMEEATKHGIQYLELPVCFDALTVMVHPSNDWAKHMTVEEVKMIFEPAAEDKITKWNQVRKEWPDLEIKIFSPGGDSGTFDYFTEAIVGQAKKQRRDRTTFSEDDNVLLQGIANNKGAIGYMGFTYYANNKGKVNAVAIKSDKNPKTKDAVMPSNEAVLDGSYYPLSRPLFIYVSKKALERPEVKAFAEYFLKNGKDVANEVKYLPLPDKAYELALDRLSKMQLGTAFGGVPEVGVPVEEILKRTPKS
jgi:phosphate transport system substrate-binding protein